MMKIGFACECLNAGIVDLVYRKVKIKMGKAIISTKKARGNDPAR